MALKEREQKLIGAMLIVGAIAAFVGVGLPNFDTISKSLAKKKELEDENKSLDTQKATLETSVKALQEAARLPNDMQVRQYTAETQQKVVKELLDSVIKYSAKNGNTVVYLKPWADVPKILPPPPPVDTTAAAAAGTPGATTPPATTPPPSPADMLTTVGYEFAMRGTYQTIQNFLEAMDEQKEILELNSIQLVNEAGADRVGGKGAIPSTDVLKDPTKPIRLTVKLRLVLENKTP